MTPTPSHATGANVKAEMARRGVTQTVLAEMTGIPQSALSKRLRGRIAFNVNELAGISAALGVPLADLLPSESVAS